MFQTGEGNDGDESMNHLFNNTNKLTNAVKFVRLESSESKKKPKNFNVFYRIIVRCQSCSR